MRYIVFRAPLTAVLEPSGVKRLSQRPAPVLILTALLLAGMFKPPYCVWAPHLRHQRQPNRAFIRYQRGAHQAGGVSPSYALMVAIAGLILSSRLGAGSFRRQHRRTGCHRRPRDRRNQPGRRYWQRRGRVMGAYIMSALDNGMSMMDVATFWQFIVKGVILLLAVWMDSATKRRN